MEVIKDLMLKEIDRYPDRYKLEQLNGYISQTFKEERLISRDDQQRFMSKL